MLANEIAPLSSLVGLHGHRAGVGSGGDHAREGGITVDPGEFGHGEGDRNILLERDVRKAADLVVGDRIRVDLDQRGTAAGGLGAQDVHPVLLGGHADPPDRHRARERARDVVQGGSHLGEVVLADVADHADRGPDQLAFVDLLKVGQHGHALDDQRVGVIRGGAPDDPDLLDDVGQSELPVDRLLQAVRRDEPGRRTGGLRHGYQAAAAQRTRAQPGDRALAADAVDHDPTRDAAQMAVVAALLHDPGDQRHGAAQRIDGEEIGHVSVRQRRRCRPREHADPGSAPPGCRRGRTRNRGEPDAAGR